MHNASKATRKSLTFDILERIAGVEAKKKAAIKLNVSSIAARTCGSCTFLALPPGPLRTPGSGSGGLLFVFFALFFQRQREITSPLAPGSFGRILGLIQSPPVLQIDLGHVKLERIILEGPSRIEAGLALGDAVEVGNRFPGGCLDQAKLHDRLHRAKVQRADPGGLEFLLRFFLLLRSATGNFLFRQLGRASRSFSWNFEDLTTFMEFQSNDLVLFVPIKLGFDLCRRDGKRPEAFAIFILELKRHLTGHIQNQASILDRHGELFPSNES